MNLPRSSSWDPGWRELDLVPDLCFFGTYFLGAIEVQRGLRRDRVLWRSRVQERKMEGKKEIKSPSLFKLG